MFFNKNYNLLIKDKYITVKLDYESVYRVGVNVDNIFIETESNKIFLGHYKYK